MNEQVKQEIVQEIAFIEEALQNPNMTEGRYKQYNAAAIALLWALNPERPETPYLAVTNDKLGRPKAYAYSRALALESWEFGDALSADEIERFARTVAYKVWHNINNDLAMDESIDTTRLGMGKCR